MSHGFGGSSIGPKRAFVDFSRILNQNGYSTLRFDQPNSGNSEGDYLNTSYNEWVDTIVYFANKYLNLGYKVSLLGQSMGGAAVVIASSRLGDKIPCLLLWVPGVNEDDFKGKSDEILEENGQKFMGKYWIEVQENNFFKCLEEYTGGIHVVYGEHDKYISQEKRNQVMEAVKGKGQSIKVLKGQDHSPWEFDLCQQVYEEELVLLKKYC